MVRRLVERWMACPARGPHACSMTSETLTIDLLSDDADERERELVEELRRYVPEAMRVTGTPGMNVALACGERVVWEAGFGFSDLAAGAPMTPTSVHRAGSIAKIYAAIAFLQLVERGVLDLYDPISRHLPAPRAVNPLGERELTIWDLLTFHGGLVRDTLEANLEPVDPDAYVEAELAADVRREYRGRSTRWSARVGDHYQYSSFGYAVLARLFKQASPGNLSVGEWVARHVLEPLGLRNTALPEVDDDAHVPAHMRANRCTGYARFGPVYVPTPVMYTGSYTGSGLQTTPGDHVRTLLALRHGGALDDVRVLDAASVRHMLTPQRSAGESERAMGILTANGIGIELANLGRHDYYFGRTGSYAWGWWLHGRAYPRQDFAVAGFTNKWDMQGWMNPDGRSAGALVADFVSAARGREQGAERPPERPWGWRYSYAVGLLMAERIGGLLGLPERLDDATVATMASEARVLGPVAGEEPWDADGFRAGVDEIRAIDPSPAALRELLRSPRLQVAPEELQLHWLRLGSQGRAPIPMSFYANALAEAERVGRRRRRWPRRDAVPAAERAGPGVVLRRLRQSRLELSARGRVALPRSARRRAAGAGGRRAVGTARGAAHAPALRRRRARAARVGEPAARARTDRLLDAGRTAAADAAAAELDPAAVRTARRTARALRAVRALSARGAVRDRLPPRGRRRALVRDRAGRPRGAAGTRARRSAAATAAAAVRRLRELAARASGACRAHTCGEPAAAARARCRLERAPRFRLPAKVAAADLAGDGRALGADRAWRPRTARRRADRGRDGGGRAARRGRADDRRDARQPRPRRAAADRRLRRGAGGGDRRADGCGDLPRPSHASEGGARARRGGAGGRQRRRAAAAARSWRGRRRSI